MREFARVLLMLVVVCAHAQTAREPAVGLPCQGCEAVFVGMPESLSAHARITPEHETGEPMQVRGTVFDRQGRPQPGIVVYAYQTDAAGIYPPAPSVGDRTARRHGRLRAWVSSDGEGRYRFDTIRPGSYPDRMGSSWPTSKDGSEKTSPRRLLAVGNAI